jgi:hypothetical protein
MLEPVTRRRKVPEEAKTSPANSHLTVCAPPDAFSNEFMTP